MIRAFTTYQITNRWPLFIFCLAITSLFALSLGTFSPLDPSALSVSIPAFPTANAVGKIGSSISASAIYHFGFSAYYIAFVFASISVSIFRTSKPWSWVKSAIVHMIIFSLITIILPYISPTYTVQDFSFKMSGVQGEIFRQSMLTLVGLPGVLIFYATVACLISYGHLLFLGKYVKKVPVFPNLKVLMAPLSIPKERISQNALIAEPAKTGRLNQELLSQKNQPEGKQFKNLSPLRSETVFPSSEIAPVKLSAEELSEFKKTSDELQQAFSDFGITGVVTDFRPGPTVTVYEYRPNAGTKLAKLVSLVDDLALALKVDSVFIHPVSGKNVVGVQVPNRKSKIVHLGELLKSPSFKNSKSHLTFVVGKNLHGDAVCEDLASMPHLLMAGQTGSGKSVAINTLLCSILMKSTAADVKMILVDPKILELKVYEGIENLMLPVITDPVKAAAALKWACHEMDRRYHLMEQAQVRHIESFNNFWEGANSDVKADFAAKVSEIGRAEKLPYLLIVIDELADIMLTAPKDVECSIQRLAQKARACGIHLVLATQRPSVDVITGVIKANLPCRIAFKVFSRGDSRTILDCIGAEKLLGKGDMLYLKPGTLRLERIQGAFVSDQEVIDFIDSIKATSSTNYDESAMTWIEENYSSHSSDQAFGPKGSSDSLDEKWEQSLEIAQSYGHISASFLQRQLKIGYNRASRIVEDMESRGLVSKSDGSKPRKWLSS